MLRTGSNDADETCKHLALVQSMLGEHTAAIAAIEQAHQRWPESLDPVNGPPVSFYRSVVLARAGRSAEAYAEVERLLRVSGPSVVTTNATVAEMDAQGQLHVLSKGTNEWVCCPGNENIIGDVPMALDPMGMQWFMDLHARKPKPTNTAPGLIYMLCGAIQHSYTDPFDRTSPPIPIGPHWMLLWPFDAKAVGMGTVMRDAGTMVMFAGTPYAHLPICGSPWDGNEYYPDDRIIRTLTYVRPR
jgi:hypothetical protein